jgi:hypothetical protein
MPLWRLGDARPIPPNTLLSSLPPLSQPIRFLGLVAWGCYASLRINYALFSMLITGYIALLFA